jgi:gliding motility-associatede transport system auxiliary component
MAVDDDKDPQGEEQAPAEETAAEPAALAPPPAPSAESDGPGGRPAPAWIVPLYVAGLALVYLGERIVSTVPTWHWVVTGTGIAAAVMATVLRFSPRFRVGGERRHIERVLAFLSLTGLVAVAIYFASGHWAATDVAGLSDAAIALRDRIYGILTVLWIVLVGVSVVPMLFAEAALYPMRYAERPESRRVRAAAAAGLTLVLAAVYGALFVYAASGIGWRADYSYFKTSRPSESTRKIAMALDKPVQVVAFFPEVSDVRREVARYLHELVRGVPNLKIQIVDRLMVPKLARKLRATRDGEIVLSKGTVDQVLDIGANMKEARPKLKTLDRDFQAKLLKLVRAERTAYVTVGHGELSDTPTHYGEPGHGRSADIVRILLQKQNYVVKDLGLAQGLGGDVPADADLVLVLGPTEPFSPEEIASLKRYAARGGKLFVALDPDAIPTERGTVSGPEALDAASAASSKVPKSPAAPHAAKRAAAKNPTEAKPAALPPAPGDLESSLEQLANVVGLKFDPTVLANDREYVRRRFNASDRTQLVTNRFSSHASVSTLSRNSSRAAVFLFGAGSFERAPGTTDKIDFTVRSLPGTFADTNHDYQYESNERRSVYNLCAAVDAPATSQEPGKPKADKNPKDQEPSEMRAFACADADAFSDMVLGQVMTNQLLFVDAVRWLGGESSFAGEVNNTQDRPIEHTKQKDLVWFYSTIFGAPALVLGLGLMISRRSRRGRRRRRQ